MTFEWAMRYVAWFFRIVLFLLLLGFALRNSETATLRYYFDYEWQAPLVVILLAFFAAGLGVGVLACLGAIFRQRKEIAALKREQRIKGELAAHPGHGMPVPDRE